LPDALTLEITGKNNQFLGGVLTNNGTVIQGVGPGSLGFNGDALLVNNGTYDFRADATGIFINSGPAATFVNNGTVKKSAVTDATNRSSLRSEERRGGRERLELWTGCLAIAGKRNSHLAGVLTNTRPIFQGVGPGALGFNGDANLVNNGTYDFRADATGIFINSGPAATFTNNGTVKKSAVTDATNRSSL